MPIIDRSRDLRPDPEPKKPAACGFLPKLGWSHKWARDGHRDACDKCAEIEADEALRDPRNLEPMEPDDEIPF